MMHSSQGSRVRTTPGQTHPSFRALPEGRSRVRFLVTASALLFVAPSASSAFVTSPAFSKTRTSIIRSGEPLSYASAPQVDKAFDVSSQGKEKQTSLMRSINRNRVDAQRNKESSDTANVKRKVQARPMGKRPESVKVVTTLEEYKEHVADVSDRLVVVRFHAPYCRACRAIESSFYRLASTYPNVQFVEVPASKENHDLMKGLGVPCFPFAHIYHPQSGLVEETKMSKMHFKRLERTLLSYVLGLCELPEDEGATSDPPRPLSASSGGSGINSLETAFA